MFRDMRRIKQQLSQEEALAVLERNETGVLSVQGEEGYPYGVPLNYVLHQGKIYFHGAKVGHKAEALKASPKVCFTVIDLGQVDAQNLATDFRSVVVFGEARILESDEEIRQAAAWVGLRFNPDQEVIQKEIEREWPALSCVEITIHHITGKESKSLAAQRNR